VTEKEKPNKNTLIVAINLGLLIAYTLYIRISGGNGYSIIFLATIIALHFLASIIIFALTSLKGFLLSAALIVLIGFSTCIIAYNIH
jgi:hypothetical protein